MVRTPHHTILVDTCVGNDRKRSLPVWNQMRTDYPDRLAAAGVVPEEVDYVFCTHMHVDHVGWNTRLENGRFVPAFPNAKYLFHRTEWEHWKETEEEIQAEVVKDSLLPIVDAGLAEMVESDHVIEDGVRLLPTPATPRGTAASCSGRRRRGRRSSPATSSTTRSWWRSRTGPPGCAGTRKWRSARGASSSNATPTPPPACSGTHFAPPTAVRIESGPGGCRVAF